MHTEAKGREVEDLLKAAIKEAVSEALAEHRHEPEEILTVEGAADTLESSLWIHVSIQYVVLVGCRP